MESLWELANVPHKPKGVPDYFKCQQVSSGDVPRGFVMLIHTGNLPEGSEVMMAVLLERLTNSTLQPGQHYVIL